MVCFLEKIDTSRNQQGNAFLDLLDTKGILLLPADLYYFLTVNINAKLFLCSLTKGVGGI